MTNLRTLAASLEARIGTPTTPEARRALCVATSMKDRNYHQVPASLKALHAKTLDEFEQSLCAHEEGC